MRESNQPVLGFQYRFEKVGDEVRNCTSTQTAAEFNLGIKPHETWVLVISQHLSGLVLLPETPYQLIESPKISDLGLKWF